MKLGPEASHFLELRAEDRVCIESASGPFDRFGAGWVGRDIFRQTANFDLIGHGH